MQLILFMYHLLNFAGLQSFLKTAIICNFIMVHKINHSLGQVQKVRRNEL